MDRDAARLMGLPVARRTMLLCLAGGPPAGFAGTLAAAYSGSSVSVSGWSWTRSRPWSSAARCSPAGPARSAARCAGVLLLRVIQNAISGSACWGRRTSRW
jgi:galactofuranose transport system permease protein